MVSDTIRRVRAEVRSGGPRLRSASWLAVEPSPTRSPHPCCRSRPRWLVCRPRLRSNRDDDRHQVVVQVDDARSAPDVVADAGGEPASTAPLGGSSYASVELSSAGLAKLAADDRVGHVLTRGTTVGPALADSVPLIGAPGRWADGSTGDGKVVEIGRASCREEVCRYV